MKLGNKIIAAAICSLALAVGAALIIQKQSIEHQGIEMLRSSMHAMLVEAESVRESISQLGSDGAFDRKKLIEDYQKSGDLRGSTLYKTVPVVAAWEAAGRAAKEEGLDFRIAKNQARSPKISRPPKKFPSSTPSKKRALRNTSKPIAPPTPPSWPGPWFSPEIA